MLNIVTTTRTGDVMEPIIRDPRLRKLTFTGSTAVGRSLVEQSAEGLLRVSMELGGNAPFLVFDDADVDAAVDGAMLAKMRNIGEACTAANRFIVHESVASEFGEKLAARMGGLVVGRGTDGCRRRPAGRGEAARLGGRARRRRGRQGSHRAHRWAAVQGDGWFFEPTVLADVPADARVRDEEIFGPVAPIITFTDEDEALRIANDTEYGLVAYAFTRDVSRVVRIYEGLETGMVGINQGIVSNPAAPFGGVKASGFGREGGSEGIEEYLETKYVGLALSRPGGRPRRPDAERAPTAGAVGALSRSGWSRSGLAGTDLTGTCCRPRRPRARGPSPMASCEPWLWAAARSAGVTGSTRSSK